MGENKRERLLLLERFLALSGPRGLPEAGAEISGKGRVADG